MLLLVAVRAVPVALAHLLPHSFQLKAVAHQQARPAEAAVGGATLGALRLACTGILDFW